MFKTVLFPVDQSRESRQAAETVATLVKTHQSRLIILSVVEPPEAEVPSTDAMESPQVVAELLQNAKKLFSQQGIEAEALEREGKPAFTICDVADELDADLIIMGCRGLGLTHEGTSESVTNRVISLSPCPVLVIP
ncbi:universal stress protein [Phormidesmis priestleyi ULC007]|uniref:Universal stress protein n=1 Tax=Phormidesmis priestleyi ULC007 TaxID=1920490 RepID=A0A2T1DFJ8_9CYAN|nr:universal stress protein [Phormidesmis priestleyi]PSB19269.1 universal stress protein [Phormidesmis priestleyi ULC007]PZO52153.1 MAG: universal stress protein [Phormidesmis priestleyi]